MKMPVLDKNFYPMIKALNDFEKTVKENGNSVKVTLVAERSGGYNYVYSYDALGKVLRLLRFPQTRNLR